MEKKSKRKIKRLTSGSGMCYKAGFWYQMTGAVGNARPLETHFRRLKNNSLVRTLLFSTYAALLLAAEKNLCCKKGSNWNLGADALRTFSSTRIWVW